MFYSTNGIIKANSLALLTVGQLLEGIPWGLFIANSPAYASEVVPIVLRGACTATLQMSWSIGGIIVAGMCIFCSCFLLF
jgi:SP family general alpha glucoside:H+ symporter-like MFS transporter